MPTIEITRPKYRSAPVIAVVLVVVAALAGLARMPGTSDDVTQKLASRFHFAVQQLPLIPVDADVVYPVNKIAKHMQFYYYQVGESAALGDLDGDGLPNDLCQTDVRAKKAMVSPVPGTGARYAPFVLDFGKYFDKVTEHPSVCRIADMNEDGLADIFVGFYGRPPLLLLRKATADLKAGAPISMDSYQIQELIPGLNQRWWTATANFADLDGDGHMDLFVGNYYADGSELTDANIDKPFEMNEDFSRAKNGGMSRIFLHAGSTSGPAPTVQFRNLGDVLPNRGGHAWTLATGAADLDRDGLSDFYIANDFGPDQLLMNRSTPGSIKFQELKGEASFARPSSMVIGKDTFKGMSVDFADVNNDGIFDWFVSNIASPFAMQEGHFLWISTGKMDKIKEGKAPWVDQADVLGVSRSAWAWDARFEDFDNDGTVELAQATGLVKGTENRWPDLAQVGGANDQLVKHPASWPRFLPDATDVDGAVPKPFWVRGDDGHYVNLSSVLFPDMLAPTRGIAVADVDGDGYPEMVYANFWQNSVYIKNKGSGSAFMGLHLMLPTAGSETPAAVTVHDGHPTWREGTPAIGAFVEIETADGKKQIRQVDGGNGHSGQRSPEVRFGLGKTSLSTATAPVQVRITWRDFSGALHHDSLALTPGYHTVLLAAKGTK
jgi:hypothetical protein